LKLITNIKEDICLGKVKLVRKLVEKLLNIKHLKKDPQLLVKQLRHSADMKWREKDKFEGFLVQINFG
jgi:hypothetical protein